MKYDNPTCLNVIRFSKYKLSPDEMTIFDWLINKQEAFKHEPFFYQFRRIEEETRIKKDRFNTIIGKFCLQGFLKIVSKGDPRVKAKVNYFFVDFNEVIKALPSIIDKDKDPEYFKSYKGWLKERVKNKGKSVCQPEVLKGYEKTSLMQYFQNLENLWNRRIDYHNKHREDDRKRTHTHLPVSDARLLKLRDLLKSAKWDAIEDSFIAFTDVCLERNSEVKRPIDNFLSSKKGVFKVFEYYLDYFNRNYSVSTN